ncbi:MAG TPA: acyl-CoA dehydrogenase family protein [Acidimicrobiales bacterium]|jgi:alkylation response protein AidB-like acyl-CoA dehydrogenase|nr:acyl-CoA dehydrogenase family protein [Acidimicrobiales bacterium]
MADLDADRDLDAFTARAAAFLADAAAAGTAPVDWGAIVPPERVDEARAWQAELHAAGFAGIHWPVEYGGRGLTIEHTAAWTTECAKAEAPAFLNMVGHVLTAGSLLLFGSDQQKAAYLPGIASGDKVWCQLFSEPGAGSDLASLTTRAVSDGDSYVLTGQKVWCSNGRVADFGICLARTLSLDEQPKKHKGISFFLVDMTAPGIEVRPLRQMTGGSEFDEVFIDEVTIPASSLLGPEHEGWGVAMATLTNERGHIGSASISMQRRLDRMAAGLAGATSALERQRVASLIGRGNVLAMLGGRQGPVASVASSLSKLGVTELMFDAAVARSDAAGANGMLAGSDANGLVAAPGGRIAGGTTQVQKNIIGERILGLPKDPS